MPSNPHDHLFKAVFSRLSDAASFLSAHFPPDLAAAIQWDRLVCLRTGFEEPDGTSPEADLLFSVPLVGSETEGDDEPQEIEIAILFEHQSTPDDRMPLRLLGYMLRTFEAQLAERARKRPVPVVPIVLYHGERPWTGPTRFIDWMNLPPGHVRILADFIPDFTHILEVRRPPRPDAYLGSDTVRFMRLLLDHGRTRDFFPSIDAWAEVIIRLEQDLDAQGMLPVLAIAVSYLYRVRSDAAEPFAEALERINAQVFKEIAVNTYEQAIEKGEKRGLQQGLTNERTVLLRQCTKRFGALPLDAQARIQAADHETLLHWADNFVDAQSLDDVFGDTRV